MATTATVLGGMVLVLSLVSSGSAQTGNVIRSLEPGEPVEREMAGGETLEYPIELQNVQYCHLVVAQRGMLVIERRATAGRKPVPKSLVVLADPGFGFGRRPAA